MYYLDKNNISTITMSMKRKTTLSNIFVNMHYDYGKNAILCNSM